MTIELKTGMSVPGMVTWVEDGNAGVTFDEPVDVLDVLAADASGPRPRMPRIEIDCHATIRDGASTHRLKVRDVSQGGLKLEGDAQFDESRDLSVTLPGLAPLPAALRWSEDGFLGLTFNRLMSLDELVGWLRTVRESKAA